LALSLEQTDRGHQVSATSHGLTEQIKLRSFRVADAKQICGSQNFRWQKDNASPPFASAALANGATRREHSNWWNQDWREKRWPKIRGDSCSAPHRRRALNLFPR
jgi:hypothetical protein